MKFIRDLFNRRNKISLGRCFLIFFLFEVNSGQNLCFAQSPKQVDSVIIVSMFPTLDLFDSQGQPIVLEEILYSAKYIEPVPEAFKYLYKARKYHHLHYGFGSPGLLFAGLGVLSFIVTETGNSGLLIFGGSVLLASGIVMVALRNPALKKGIKIYNEEMYKKRLEKTRIINE